MTTIPSRTELTPVARRGLSMLSAGFGGSRDMRALYGGQGLAGNQRDAVRTCYLVTSFLNRQQFNKLDGTVQPYSFQLFQISVF